MNNDIHIRTTPTYLRHRKRRHKRRRSSGLGFFIGYITSGGIGILLGHYILRTYFHINLFQ